MKDGLKHAPEIQVGMPTRAEQSTNSTSVDGFTATASSYPELLLFLGVLISALIFLYYDIFIRSPLSKMEIKQQDKSLNLAALEDSHDVANPIKTLMQMVDQTLRMQAFQSVSFDTSNEDDFISGYIGGYCDAVSRINGIDNNSAEGAAILSVGFQAVYKKEDPLKNFFERQTSSKKMKEGIQVGFQDVIDWLKPSSEEYKKSPDGLIKYLRRETDVTALVARQNVQVVEVEQLQDTNKFIVESMIEFADLYYGKSVNQLLKLLRKNKMHYVDDGGDTISVHPSNNEPFYVIFGTDRSEEPPSITIFSREDYTGITVFVMGKSINSWAGSLEPTPSSGMGNSARVLFNRLLHEYGMRDLNSF